MEERGILRAFGVIKHRAIVIRMTGNTGAEGGM